MTNIPEHDIDSLRRYVDRGIPLGSFLEAIVSNDLLEAFNRADTRNRSVMFEYIHYLNNEMPVGCHGSRRAYNAWCKHNGMEGISDVE